MAKRRRKSKSTQHKQTQFFVADNFEISPAEIEQYTDPAIIKRIKSGGDASPEFRAYAVAHEGKVNGRYLEDGGPKNYVTKYLRPLVEKMHSALSIGTKIFEQHGDGTNSHANRTPIGEVVGKMMHDVGGSLYNIAIAYIDPNNRHKQLDVASVEADLVYSRAGGEVTIDEVSGISGIALGSSNLVEPGFPGATLRGAFQAFREAKMEVEMDSLEDVQQAIEAGGYALSEVFTRKQITADASVKDIVRTHQGHAKRVEAQLGEDRTAFEAKEATWQGEQAKLTGENEELRAANLGFRAKPVLADVLKERKLTDKAHEFITMHAGAFKPADASDDKALRAAAGEFADVQLESYKQTAKLFGQEVEGDGAADTKNGDAGAPAGDRGGLPNDADDMSSPENNTFIPSVPKMIGMG